MERQIRVYFKSTMNIPSTKTSSRQLKRHLVGVAFICLPFLAFFTFGLYVETVRPWVTGMDFTIPQLPNWVERCFLAVFNGRMLFAIPPALAGLALLSAPVSVGGLIFSWIGIGFFGIGCCLSLLDVLFASNIPPLLYSLFKQGLGSFLIAGITPAILLACLLSLLRSSRHE